MDTDNSVDELKAQIKKLEDNKAGLLSDLVELKTYKREIDDLGGLQNVKERLQEKERQKETKTQNDDFYKSEISKYQQELDKFKKSMAEEKLSNKLKTAVSKAGGVYELLEPVLKKRIESELVDGNQLRLNIKDANGNPLIVEGQDATLTQLIDTFKQDEVYQKVFTNGNFSGSGSQPSQATGNVGGMTQSKWDEMTLDQRTDWGRKNPTKINQFLKNR